MKNVKKVFISNYNEKRTLIFFNDQLFTAEYAVLKTTVCIVKDARPDDNNNNNY